MPRSSAPRRPPSTARKIVSTVVANLALPASAIVTGPILARALGPEGRGEVAAVIAPLTLAAYLFTLGVPEAIVFHVTTGRVSVRRITRSALTLAVIYGLIGSVALFLVTPLLFASKPELIPLATTLIAVLPLLLIFAAVRAHYQARGDFRTIVRERWTSVGLRLVLLVTLAIAGLLSVEVVAWLSQIVLVVGGVTLFIGLRRARLEGDHDSEPRVTRRMLSYGSRVWLGSLSSILIVRLDQVLMVPLTSTRQLGFYAVALAVSEVPTAAFAALRDVMFSRAAATDGLAAVALSARIVIMLFVPVTVIFAIAAPWLVPIAFGEEFVGATLMAQILWAAALPAGLAGLFAAAMLTEGRPGLVSSVQVVIALANGALMLLLVPVLGGVGAALATTVAYICSALGLAVLLSRLSGAPLSTLLVPRRQDWTDLLGAVRRRAD